MKMPCPSCLSLYPQDQAQCLAHSGCSVSICYNNKTSPHPCPRHSARPSTLRPIFLGPDLWPWTYLKFLSGKMLRQDSVRHFQGFVHSFTLQAKWLVLLLWVEERCSGQPPLGARGQRAPHGMSQVMIFPYFPESLCSLYDITNV